MKKSKTWSQRKKWRGNKNCYDDLKNEDDSRLVLFLVKFPCMRLSHIAVVLMVLAKASSESSFVFVRCVSNNKDDNVFKTSKIPCSVSVW